VKLTINLEKHMKIVHLSWNWSFKSKK